jgi:hypothetical protein
MSSKAQKLQIPKQSSIKVAKSATLKQGSPTVKHALSMQKASSLTARPMVSTSGERFPGHILKQATFDGYRDPRSDLQDLLYKRLYSEIPDMYVSPRTKELQSNLAQGGLRRDPSEPLYKNLSQREATPRGQNVREIPQYVDNLLGTSNANLTKTLPNERNLNIRDEYQPSPKSIYKDPTYSPTLKDTSKMRNPIYSAFDYSKYDATNPQARYVPDDYNYKQSEPISPKTYAKTHLGHIAKSGTNDNPNQSGAGQRPYIEEFSKPVKSNYEDLKSSPYMTTGSGLFKPEKTIQKTSHYIPFENVKRGVIASLGESAWKANVQNLSLASASSTTNKAADKGGYEPRYATISEPKNYSLPEQKSYSIAQPKSYYPSDKKFFIGSGSGPRYEASSVF